MPKFIFINATTGKTISHIEKLNTYQAFDEFVSKLKKPIKQALIDHCEFDGYIAMGNIQFENNQELNVLLRCKDRRQCGCCYE